MTLENFEKAKVLLELQNSFEKIQKISDGDLSTTWNRCREEETSEIVATLRENIKLAYEEAYSKIDALFEAL